MVGIEVDKNKIVVVLRCVFNKVVLLWKLYIFYWKYVVINIS